ncbi:hypothetical protein CSQ85_07380 [Bifidobacterium rousetti]|uniref:hypothetical protein n=1 Tax=Bifidobacterium rousetti TaxID=2045439 RepID=UPI001238ABD1|nr:hypothetical protein [Bifidobacterium rousetti]KAA8818689.1 hypothetical protein CSQ85_07380 [Bifidobacterium rousetti]
MRIGDGVQALLKSPVAFVGVVLAAVASDVLMPLAWWRGDRLLWWVIPGVVWAVGLLLLAAFLPASGAASDSDPAASAASARASRAATPAAGVAALAFLGQLVFAVLMLVVNVIAKPEGRFGLLFALLVLVVALVSLIALSRGGEVRDAALWPLLVPFVLFIDRVPAVNWMTIHLPLLFAFGLLFVQIAVVWHTLTHLPAASAVTVAPAATRARHGGE